MRYLRLVCKYKCYFNHQKVFLSLLNDCKNVDLFSFVCLSLHMVMIFSMVNYNARRRVWRNFFYMSIDIFYVHARLSNHIQYILKYQSMWIVSQINKYSNNPSDEHILILNCVKRSNSVRNVVVCDSNPKKYAIFEMHLWPKLCTHETEGMQTLE